MRKEQIEAVFVNLPKMAAKGRRLNLQIPFKIPSVDFLDSLATVVHAFFLARGVSAQLAESSARK